MSKHTPGPRRIHMFVHHDDSVTETDALHADASYVRADIADEMLAALELAYAVMPAPKHGTIGYARMTVACDAVTDAIAKAKGESE